MESLAEQSQSLIGIELTPLQISRMELLSRELQVWNERISLTAIRDPHKIKVKHFLDSLTCLLPMRGTPMNRVVDVGTGAGFPGIPLKIACPQMHLTLVESVGKKADFCRHAVEALELRGVEIYHGRVETFAHLPGQRESYDWAVARAVAQMPVLMEYLLPLVRVGGSVLAQKGESGPAEAQSADRAIQLLGGHLRQITPVTLPGVTEDRYLIVTDKVVATPERYPRRTGIPAKRPLD